ncbi:hypothetical protein [Clostridium thermosuccinogenes]|jgi:hypothetical protein|nr:hypothetical protein [Pseudoclostridium thermosuccinogenes]
MIGFKSLAIATRLYNRGMHAKVWFNKTKNLLALFLKRGINIAAKA